MFIIQPYENQENQLVIDDLKKKLSLDFPVFASEKELSAFVEKQDHIPQIGVFFIRDAEEIGSRLEAVHKLFDSRHQMVFLIGVMEPESKKYEKTLSDLFECLLNKPLNAEILLKEIKKGENLIQSLNSQMSYSIAEDQKGSGLEGMAVPEVSFLFNHQLTGIRGDLEKIRHSVSVEERKQILTHLKENMVWPDKVTAKNVQPGTLFYDEKYFSLNEETGELRAVQVGLVELALSELHFYPAVEIAPDAMKTFGFVFPFSGMDDRDGLNLYIEGMQKAGVVKGLIFDAINRAYVRNYEAHAMEYLLLAEGRLPQDGYGEYVELKKIRKKQAGKIVDKIGTIDYREQSSIINLKPGEVIAEKIPEKPAADGYDVMGKPCR